MSVSAFFIIVDSSSSLLLPFFFFNDTATTEIYTLSLHDALPIRFTSHPAQRRPRSMDEECAQRTIAPFASTQQALLPSRRMLAWHQPQPGGKLPAVLERTRIADGSHQGRRPEGPNPGNRPQPLTRGMGRGQGFELLLIRGELLLQGGKLLSQLPKHLLAQGSELVLFG